MSRISPIYKSGDRGCVDNYRRISILSMLSKILQRVINNSLVIYLEDNNLLAASQFGFRRKKSTSDAVHELTNFIVTSIDSKNKVIGIFLDLAKAFNRVSIQILLKRLEHLGIRGSTETFLMNESYLTKRTQCVKKQILRVTIVQSSSVFHRLVYCAWPYF